MDEDWLKQAICEFIGPFALVFAGVGSIIATQGHDLVAIALAHGLAIGLIISAAGHISGGHYNPAVTIGFLATGRISVPKAVMYIVAQLLGALAAALILTQVYPDLGDFGRNNVGVNLGALTVGAGMTPVNALIVEAVMTFFLMFVIYGVAVDGRTGKAIAGLAIGLTITMDILLGGPASGAAMNPARWFGPAVVQQAYGDWWVWWVGPIIGAVLAALLFNYVLLGNAPPMPTRPDAITEPPRPSDPARSSSPRSQARRKR